MYVQLCRDDLLLRIATRKSHACGLIAAGYIECSTFILCRSLKSSLCFFLCFFPFLLCTLIFLLLYDRNIGLELKVIHSLSDLLKIRPLLSDVYLCQ